MMWVLNRKLKVVSKNHLQLKKKEDLAHLKDEDLSLKKVLQHHTKDPNPPIRTRKN